jgi:hypothetical protein
VTRDPKEFRLYPRKPRQRTRDESKAWSIAFKRIMHLPAGPGRNVVGHPGALDRESGSTSVAQYE